MNHIINESGLKSDSIYVDLPATTSREEIGNDTHLTWDQREAR